MKILKYTYEIIITINSPEERIGAIFDGDNYQTNLVLQPSLSCYLSVCDDDQVQGLQGSMVAQGNVAPGGSGQSSQLDDPQSTLSPPSCFPTSFSVDNPSNMPELAAFV